MDELILPLEELVEQLRKLPGVGRKTAVKYAFRLLEMSEDEAERFSGLILEAKHKVKRCSICSNICEGDICSICSDEGRDGSIICVVEDVKDVMAIEKAHGFKGRYHVLEGAISPMDGKGPDQLRIKELLSRVSDGNIKEIIIATNPTVEGETTAMYITRLLKPLGIKVSRLAYGIPVGGDLEYADEVTLMRAIEGRREM